MEHIAGEFNQAKGKMVDDLKMVVTDGEELLRAAASIPGKGLSAAQASLADSMLSIKATIADLSQPVTLKARQANDYVHGNPWPIVGVAAALGVLLGYLTSRR